MAASENGDNIDTETKLKLVTRDIVVMLNETRDLLKIGGDLDCAVDSALVSFAPLMDSLGIMHGTGDNADGPPSETQPENNKTISGPKARRGSKRPSLSRMDSAAKRAAPSEKEVESSSEPDESQAVESGDNADASVDDTDASNVSPKLTHHSFRGDSTFEESDTVEERTQREESERLVDENTENSQAEVPQPVRRVQTARKHTAPRRQTARRGRAFH